MIGDELTGGDKFSDSGSTDWDVVAGVGVWVKIDCRGGTLTVGV